MGGGTRVESGQPVTAGDVDAGDILEALSDARADGSVVLARGAGRRLPMAGAGFHVLSTLPLAGVRAYHPENLTVEVGAGTTAAALNEELSGHGQWFPVGLLDGDDDTLGGIVSAGLMGSFYGYGPVRDRVLGMTVVTPAFGTVRLGAGVVKSVAGYNMPRLYWGSRGAFGIITSLILRLSPIPRVPLETVRSGDTTDPRTLLDVKVREVLDAGWPEARAIVWVDRGRAWLEISAPSDVLRAAGFSSWSRRAPTILPGTIFDRAWGGDRERLGGELDAPLASGARAALDVGSGVVHAVTMDPREPVGPAPLRVASPLYPVLARFKAAVDPEGLLLALGEEDGA